MPDRCLKSLSGSEDECRMGGAGWHDRVTGPRHRLRKVRCKTHGRAFTLYPPGHVPYGREPLLSQAEGTDACDPRSSLVGAAVASCRGEHWPDELIFDEHGPVRRTQRRRIARVSALLGFDRDEIDSRVVSELGLSVMESVGDVAQRVAALSVFRPGLSPWLRLVGAVDLVGQLGPVGVLAGVARSPLTPARSSRARSLRGPPAEISKNLHESVLECDQDGQ